MHPSCGRKKGTGPAEPELGFLRDTSKLKREAVGDSPITAGLGVEVCQ